MDTPGTRPVPAREQDLNALMAAYQRGDGNAADALVTKLSPMLYRFLTVQSGDRRHADDLLQETWLRIHRARHTYRPGEPALPWIYAIARHTRLDAFRRRRWERREQGVLTLPERAAPAASDARSLPDLEWLLAALPQGQREVISLLKIGGLTLEETARATSSTVGAVKQKAHRAYERLRQLLAEEGAR